MVSPELLRTIPFLADLEPPDLELLSTQVRIHDFADQERIFQRGQTPEAVYLVLSGQVHITTVDDEDQEVLLLERGPGTPLGLSAMLDERPCQTQAHACSNTRCVELTREQILAMIRRNPAAALDLMSALAGELSEAQHLVRSRSAHHPNVLIEEKSGFGERMADAVARFGGSWTFINLFTVTLIVYTTTNVLLKGRAWDPYPFILLNLFLSMLAAIQAPIIMMSQNRQDQKDRLRSELDFEVNRKAEAEIRALSHHLLQLKESVQQLKSK